MLPVHLCEGPGEGEVPENFIDKLSGYLIKNKVLMQRLSSAPLAGVMHISFIPAPSAGA
jgi:hypothetical protein